MSSVPGLTPVPQPAWSRTVEEPGHRILAERILASAEEAQMRDAVIAWGRARWPGSRVIHELQIGGCRVDLAFVCPQNLIGIEIKSSLDVLARLERQTRQYTRHMPETWLAFAPKWFEHVRTEVHRSMGWLQVSDGVVQENFQFGPHHNSARHAHRDMMLTVPMLYLLLKPELQSLGRQHGLRIKSKMDCMDLYRALARGLTGDQIVYGVCARLRARNVGWVADAPIPLAA